MATITKQCMIDRIAADLGYPKTDVRRILDGILNEISADLSAGNRLEFREFGVFDIADRAPRKARNPQTGATLDVPARQVVRFKAALRLRGLAERRFEA